MYIYTYGRKQIPEEQRVIRTYAIDRTYASRMSGKQATTTPPGIGQKKKGKTNLRMYIYIYVVWVWRPWQVARNCTHPGDALYGPENASPVGHLLFKFLRDPTGKATAGHYDLLELQGGARYILPASVPHVGSFPPTLEPIRDEDLQETWRWASTLLEQLVYISYIYTYTKANATWPILCFSFRIGPNHALAMKLLDMRKLCQFRTLGQNMGLQPLCELHTLGKGYLEYGNQTLLWSIFGKGTGSEAAG